jgi:hypothetical protein
MPVGLFRSEDGSVQVDYGTGTTIPVLRSKYEAIGYKPDFDKLPSEAEYWAAETKKEDDAKRP